MKKSKNHHRNKKVSFKYYLNNHRETANSITEFCNKHKELGKNAKYHFAEVLNGKRLHYKGWMDTSVKAKVNLKKVNKVTQTLIKRALID